MTNKKCINIVLVDIINPPDPIVLNDEDYDKQLKLCGCSDCLAELQ